MTDIVERLRGFSDDDNLVLTDADPLMREAAEEIERLRDALRTLVLGIQEYERINNLSPSPGKPDCWQSVTHARKLLDMP